MKKYLQLKINLLQAKQNQWIDNSRNIAKAQDNLSTYLQNTAYMDLINDYLVENLQKGDPWMNANYPKNTNYEEFLTHQTENGLKVRSKSESLIAIALSEHGIPFRYENLKTINGVNFAPDFTILDTKKQRLIYWEHFGLMDDEEYRKDFINKLKTYHQENIILGDNLIATFEYKDQPLSFEIVNRLISQNFL